LCAVWSKKWRDVVSTAANFDLKADAAFPSNTISINRLYWDGTRK